MEWPGTASELVRAVYATPWVRVVLVLLGANVALGVAVSLATGRFQLAESGRWLQTRALPLLLGAGVAKLVVATSAEATGLDPRWADAVWAFAIATLVGRLLEQLRALGAPVPEALGSAPER